MSQQRSDSPVAASTGTAQFEAFTSETVISQFPRKIDSLTPWGGQLIAGLNDGSLLFLSAPSAQAMREGETSWQATRVVKGFSKKSITQLEVMSARPLLMSLAEEGVNVHTLPELSLKCSVLRSKGANSFAWEEGRGMLALALRRRVLLYHLTGTEFVELREFTMNDIALALCPCGDGVLVASRREYTLVHAGTGAQTEVAVMGTKGPAIARLASGELLCAQDSQCIFVSPDGQVARRRKIGFSDAPTALVASGSYMLALMADKVEIRSLSRAASEKVVQVVPVAGLGAMSRSPSPSGSLFMAVSSGESHGIIRLAPVPPARQARALADIGEFTEAITICHALRDKAEAAASGEGVAVGPESDGCEDPRVLEDILRLKHGHYLFAAGEYDEGMAQFEMCSQASALILLRLFPSLVTSQLHWRLPVEAYGEPLPAVEEVTGPEERAAALAALLPYLLSHRTRLAESTLLSASSIDQVNEAVSEAIDAQAGNSSSTETVNTVVGEAVNGQGGEAGAPRSAGAEGRPARSSHPGVDEARVSATRLGDLAVMVDTAIVGAMLAAPDSGALLRFVQQPNSVDLADGERMLSVAGRYAELAALYQHQGRHDKGLELLRKLSQEPGALAVGPTGAAADLGGLPGVWAAVRYLVTMPQEDISLIKQHARWIMRADPEAGLEALLVMTPPLDPALALPILKAEAPEYCAVYLETALQMGVASPQQYHSELLLIYLQLALDSEKAGGTAAASTAAAGGSACVPRSLLDLLANRPAKLLKLFPDDISELSAPCWSRSASVNGGRAASASPRSTTGDSDVSLDRGMELTCVPVIRHQDAYQRLRDLVYKSPHIDPEYVLAKLPGSSLPEIRALMLERLGRHREALRLYVHNLNSLPLAEAYCDRVYDALKASSNNPRSGGRLLFQDPGDVYIELLSAVMDRGTMDMHRPSTPPKSTPSSRGPTRPSTPVKSDGLPLDLATWRELAFLLSRKRDRVDPLQVLELLPGGLSLADVMPFLESALACSSGHRRNLAIVKSLRKSENLQVREELVRARQVSVVLTAERACHLCHKRIGSSVFVAYPGGALAHYLCFKRKENGGQAPLEAL